MYGRIEVLTSIYYRARAHRKDSQLALVVFR
jgi:hypothetical protein